MKVFRYALVALLIGMALSSFSKARPALAATGANMVLTGHDMDYHCYYGDSNECAYFKLVLDLVRNGSALPVLVLDQGSEVSGAVANAYGSSSSSGATTTYAVKKAAETAPTLTVVDPTSSTWTNLALVDSNGNPNYSAIITASDTTCDGCDNTTDGETAINARASDIATFFNAGGGILALAGADNYATYYNFLPISATGEAVTYPFTITDFGKQTLGITDDTVASNMANCCPTHNSFALPPDGSALKVAETDGNGIAETLIAVGAQITTGGGGGVVSGGGNTAPTVNAGGPYTGIQGTAIPLSGATASDTDSDTLTYSWSMKSGPPGASCTFTTATSLNPTVGCTQLGNYTLELSVSDGSNPAVTSDASLLVFAYPVTGRFVLGDSAVATALAASSPVTVTFWSPNWNKLNPLVGTSQYAPPTFKGLASATSPTPPACGGTWTGTGSYSTAAPNTIPAYMGVLVTSHVTLAGSKVTGNIKRIVIVKPNLGYSKAQGRSGTGTIVGTYCSS